MIFPQKEKAKYSNHSSVPFFYLGVEFYLLGRIAYHKQLITSTGILFHHTIERLLLAELANGKTIKELKQKYRNHKLETYWKDFKIIKNINGKHELDGVIKRLNSAVDLRFVSLDSKSIAFMLTRQSISNMSSYESLGKKEKFNFVIVLEDMDLFFKRMVESLRINPQLVHNLMLTNKKMDDYLKDNLHLVFNPSELPPNEIKIFLES